MTAIALTGGDAHGAWFDDHQLDGAPEVIRIAVGPDGPALLDLPDDKLEPGERLLLYRRASVGIVCRRHGRGRCTRYATYIPDTCLDELQ